MKDIKELKHAHVVDIHTHQVLDLVTVRPLQRPKEANIEGLEEVRRMQRHVKRNNVILLAIELKFS